MNAGNENHEFLENNDNEKATSRGELSEWLTHDGQSPPPEYWDDHQGETESTLHSGHSHTSLPSNTRAPLREGNCVTESTGSLSDYVTVSPVSTVSLGDCVTMSTGSLRQLCDCVYCVKLEKSVKDAISRTLPSTVSEAGLGLFNYIRALKAIPEVAELEGSELDKYAECWHHSLQIGDTWLIEQTYKHFRRSWETVRTAEGTEVPVIAFYQSQEKPLPPSTEGMSDILKRLASLCREMQLISGDEPFWLGCRDVGKLMGVSHTMANDYMHILVDKEILQVVKTGALKGLKATTYLYLPNPME
jgi:hypothetical protein